MEGLIRLRRCILQTLYDLFKKHPYAQVELTQLLETCQTDIETLNWNMVYLEKAGFVELSKAFDMPPFIACSVSITAAGIDLIENEDEFDNRFSDKNPSNRSQVQGSTFRVREKDNIEGPKSS